MTPYTSQAQVIEDEQVAGHYREPAPEELEKIEAYREQYRQAFGNYPVGSHWIDSVRLYVSLVRPGGVD